jgi:cyclic-di-AMP phosphodiesterase PgpH
MSRSGLALATVLLATVLYLWLLAPPQSFFDFEAQQGETVPGGIIAPVDFQVPLSGGDLAERRSEIEQIVPVFLTYDDSLWPALSGRISETLYSVTDDSVYVEGIIREMAAMYDKGVLDVQGLRESYSGETAVLRRNSGDSGATPLGSLNIHSLSEVSVAFLRLLSEGLVPPGTADSLVTALQPNVLPDSARRALSIEDHIGALGGVDTVILAGDTIVPPGGVVTARSLRWLDALRSTEREELAGRRLRYGAARFLMLLGILAMAALYVRDSITDTWESMSRLTLLATAWLLSLAGTGLIWLVLRLFYRGSFATLVTFGAALTGIFFRRRHAAVLSFLFAAVVSAGTPHPYSSMMITASSGALAGYAAWDLRKRSSIPRSIFYAAIGGSSVLVICSLLDVSTGGMPLWIGILEVVLSSILGVGAAASLLVVFEKVFGVSTVLSIGEARNRNHPLLRELSQWAMGTWQHSQDVADLAAEAARAIDADAELVEAGGLFHDVGKVMEPRYFIENLTHGPAGQENPHDSMHPVESFRKVIGHVSEGVRLARKFHVPGPIVDIIAQHHGTTCVKSFYEKARRLASGAEEVRQSDFRYPGPLPASKEAALIMLADAVESATKNLQDPRPETLEATVSAVIEDKDTDGQLDHCQLTRGNLKSIQEAFLQVLQGRFHERVKDYPYGPDHQRRIDG